jgi:hypothetical protein
MWAKPTSCIAPFPFVGKLLSETRLCMCVCVCVSMHVRVHTVTVWNGEGKDVEAGRRRVTRQ